MSTEHNKSVIRRYYEEVLNEGDVNLLSDLAVAGYIEHDPLPGQADALEGLKRRVEILRGAFRPSFTIEDLIAEGDTVVVRWSQRGTHVRDFMGMPATGRSFTLSGIDIHRMSDGRMAEHWHVVDMLSLLQQLGMLHQPEQTVA